MKHENTGAAIEPARKTLFQPELLVLWGCLAYFAAKTFHFALRIRERVFPDEQSWVGLIGVFSRSLWLPSDSPESYPFGLVRHIPNLYFFLLGKILSLNVFAVNDLIFLRLINVLLGLLTVIFSWKLARRLGAELAVLLIFMVMLTNTVMFSFVSGAVNYDNLSTLFSVLSLYYLVCFFQTRLAWHFLVFTICIFAGMLTKNVFLPFALGLVLVFLFHERQAMVSFLRNSHGYLSQLSGKDYALVFLSFILLACNLNLYIGNKLKYDHLIPAMDQVLPIKDCLKHRLFARNYAENQFRADKLSLLEAQRIVLQIRDPGDRADAWNLLEKARGQKMQKKKERMGRIQYAATWLRLMFVRTYGIAAHLVMLKSDKYTALYYAVFGLASVLLVFRFQINQMQGVGKYLLFITWFYGVILMQFINYNNYLYSGVAELALTGRYLFPILVPLYLLAASALVREMPRWWQWGIGAAVSVLFISGEFPWFLSNVTADWYF